MYQTMKKAIIASAIIVSACVFGARAGVGPDGGVNVGGFRAERNGKYLSLDMNIGLAGLEVEPNRAVLLTPVLVNGADTLTLPSVAVYGRNRYYYYRRNFRGTMLSGADETAFRAGDRPAELAYHQIVPYADWLDGATLVLDRRDYGCCRQVLARDFSEVGRYREEFFPRLVYVRPPAEAEKRRVLEGRAYIDFPVDQTVIYPDYRRNAVELERIRATIDTVRNDPDARIDTVWLKGFASPESPYAHNTDLAKGRTEALRRHILRMYDFKDVSILTDYEPEDWDGLRRAVLGSNLEHRDEILALIDEDRDPDVKEWMIKSRYPDDYRFMLDTYYPALRHTDYRVCYVVRTYSDPDEILRVMRTHPQHLDQDEFYVAAATLEPGSEEFAEVFETAVRMFPGDEAANLNAANAALRRDDFERAGRYLERAGDGPEALYARAALAIRTGDLDTARDYLRKAADAGLQQASLTLDELEERQK